MLSTHKSEAGGEAPNPDTNPIVFGAPRARISLTRVITPYPGGPIFAHIAED